jgi:Leucine-rich repeat (LRR) protein
MLVGIAVVWVIVTARWSPWSAEGSAARSPSAGSSSVDQSAPPSCTESSCDAERVTPMVVQKIGQMDPAARRLRLHDVTNQALATVSLVPAITELEVASSLEPLDLTPLAHLAVLQRLTLTAVTVQSLTPLEKTSIQNLTFSDVRGITDLAPIARMPHVEELSLRGPLPPTLASLGGGHLRRFTVNSLSLKTLDGIERIGGLELLSLEACGAISDLSPLGRLAGLKELDLTWMPLPANPTLPPNLTTLALVSDHVTDISFLREETGLTILSLNNNDIRDLSPLAALKDLQLLSLDRNSNLKDITPLRSLPRLESLALSGTAVVSLDAVTGLPLKTIYLEHTQVKSLAPLAKVATLQIVEFLPKTFPQAEVDALRQANPKVRVSRGAD